jgi:hypothetical protein
MTIWEKCNEFNLPLWVAAIDFSKAFDCVGHACIRKALDDMGVPRAYIKVMTKLYADQTGVVVTDKESKTFSIRWGTKQGDPSSPIIFNAVLENVMVDVQAAWREKGWGLDLGAGRKSALCNLRFADDVLLLATSKEQLRQMLEDVIKATAAAGLELHFGKTVILNNIPDDLRRAATSVSVGTKQVEILPYEATTK